MVHGISHTQRESRHRPQERTRRNGHTSIHTRHRIQTRDHSHRACPCWTDTGICTIKHLTEHVRLHNILWRKLTSVVSRQWGRIWKHRSLIPCKVTKLRGLSPRAKYTTERPSLADEVSVNVCGERVPRGQRDGSLRPYCRFSRSKPLFFLSSSSSTVLTRLSGPFPDSLILRKSGRAGNRTGPVDL
jgi:hypothetical protein